MAEPRQIQHVIAAAPGAEGIYMVQTSYWETDALGAVGQVIRNGWDRGSRFDCVLNTNDPLGPLWSSPERSLWVGSAKGTIFTTAPVSFPPHRNADLRFDVLDRSKTWAVASLPDLRSAGYAPNVTAIWGTSDSDLHAATFQGSVYHWDGSSWQELATGVRSGLNHLHGTARDDVYCVGEQGVVLHFDGRRWSRLPYPGDGGQSDGLTGVRAIAPDEVFICGRAGTILHGSRHGLEILSISRMSFYGIAYFRGRLLLAAGDAGVWELQGNAVAPVKENFGAVGVFEADKHILFVEPSQEPRPRVIDYEPDDPVPWVRRAF